METDLELDGYVLVESDEKSFREEDNDCVASIHEKKLDIQNDYITNLSDQILSISIDFTKCKDELESAKNQRLDLDGLNIKLLKENAELKNNVMGLNSIIESQSKIISNLNDDIAKYFEYKNEFDIISKKYEQLQEHNYEIDSENQKLKLQIENLNLNHPNQDVINKLNQEIIFLKQNRDELEKRSIYKAEFIDKLSKEYQIKEEKFLEDNKILREQCSQNEHDFKLERNEKETKAREADKLQEELKKKNLQLESYLTEMKTLQMRNQRLQDLIKTPPETFDCPICLKAIPLSDIFTEHCNKCFGN